MKDETMSIIGQSMFNFQAALKQSGSSLEDYLGKYYFNKSTISPFLARTLTATSCTCFRCTMFP